MYAATSKYYGSEGQKSIDPVVFFKLLLVGYLENQPSDRRIIHMASMRLDILYFIGYDIDEELPWHSTLSRTRQLYEKEVFESLFQQVLSQCIAKGMLSGKRQAVDSVFVRANAAMSSLKEKEILDDALVFTRQLEQDAAKEDEDTTLQPPAESTKRSNANRTSTTDPDARMSVKPDKITRLNYLGQLSVDMDSYLITSIDAFHADPRYREFATRGENK